MFFSIGSTIATGLVPKEKAASAIAIMFTGLTVALVTGVPLGTFIGQHFGWRETFLAVSALGVVAFIGSALFVPNNIAHTPPASLAQQAQVLAEPRLLLVYAMTAIGYGGSFIAFTFLAPILTEVSGFSAGAVGWVMLVYGVSVAAGNIWGGKLADKRGPIRALQDHLRAAGRRAAAAELHGAAQLAGAGHRAAVGRGRLRQRAGPAGVRGAAGRALHAACGGRGLGPEHRRLQPRHRRRRAWAGGLIVTHLGLMHTPWIGALVVLVSLALTAWSGRLDRLGPVYAEPAEGSARVVTSH